MDKYLEYNSVNYHVKKRLRIHKPFWDQELTELWKTMKDKNKLYIKSKKKGNINCQLPDNLHLCTTFTILVI